MSWRVLVNVALLIALIFGAIACFVGGEMTLTWPQFGFGVCLLLAGLAAQSSVDRYQIENDTGIWTGWYERVKAKAELAAKYALEAERRADETLTAVVRVLTPRFQGREIKGLAQALSALRELFGQIDELCAREADCQRIVKEGMALKSAVLAGLPEGTSPPDDLQGYETLVKELVTLRNQAIAQAEEAERQRVAAVKDKQEEAQRRVAAEQRTSVFVEAVPELLGLFEATPQNTSPSVRPNRGLQPVPQLGGSGGSRPRRQRTQLSGDLAEDARGLTRLRELIRSLLTLKESNARRIGELEGAIQQANLTASSNFDQLQAERAAHGETRVQLQAKGVALTEQEAALREANRLREEAVAALRRVEAQIEEHRHSTEWLAFFVTDTERMEHELRMILDAALIQILLMIAMDRFGKLSINHGAQVNGIIARLAEHSLHFCNDSSTYRADENAHPALTVRCKFLKRVQEMCTLIIRMLRESHMGKQWQAAHTLLLASIDHTQLKEVLGEDAPATLVRDVFAARAK